MRKCYASGRQTNISTCAYDAQVEPVAAALTVSLASEPNAHPAPSSQQRTNAACVPSTQQFTHTHTHTHTHTQQNTHRPQNTPHTIAPVLRHHPLEL